jgi:DNA-binding LytR/AlgR family response regulator
VSPTAVLADDEPLLLDALAGALSRAWPQLQVVARCHDGDAALEAIARHRPDVAFLDIRMPGRSGLDVARDAGAGCATRWVFVTAYDEYALAAFEREAVDYLLKPLEPQRLLRTVARLKAQLGTAGAESAPGAAGAAAPVAGPSVPATLTFEDLQRLARLLSRSGDLSTGDTAGAAPAGAAGRGATGVLDSGEPGGPLRWLRASLRDEVRLIPVEDVVWFEAADKYVRVLTRDEEALIRTPLKDLIERLPAGEFWQIHRGTLVRVREIARTTRTLSGKLHVHLRSRPERLEVSRTFAHLFKAD